MVSANPDVRTRLEQLDRRAVLDIHDVREGDAIFGDRDRGMAFFVDGTQVANSVGENNLGIRLRTTLNA